MGCDAFEIKRRELFVRASGWLALGVAISCVAEPADAAENDSHFTKTASIALNLKKPSAIGAGNDSAIYVAGDDAVLTLDARGHEASRHRLEGIPSAMLELGPGKLLIALRYRMVTFDPGTGSVMEWARLDEKAWITSLAADEENVYVADAGNRIVLRFGRDGALKNRIGDRDPARDIPGFVVPSPYFSVALDPMGALWAANPGKHGVECYRPDGSLVSSWYRSGADREGFCGCCNPAYIAFLSDGAMVTVEKGLNRVKLYAPDMTVREVVTGPATAAELEAAFAGPIKTPPAGLAVTPSGHILLLDAENAVIDVFEKTTLNRICRTSRTGPTNSPLRAATKTGRPVRNRAPGNDWPGLRPKEVG